MNPCRQFLKSKDPEDAEVGHRIKSKSSVEPILSVRAFEFGSLYGLDILVPSPTDPALTVWDTVCLGTQLFCRQKSLIGTAKHQETIDTIIRYHASRSHKTPFPKFWEPLFPLGRARNIFDLDSVFKTRTERNGRLFSKKSAYILTHTNATVTEKRLGMLSGNDKSNARSCGRCLSLHLDQRGKREQQTGRGLRSWDSRTAR